MELNFSVSSGNFLNSDYDQLGPEEVQEAAYPSSVRLASFFLPCSPFGSRPAREQSSLTTSAARKG